MADQIRAAVSVEREYLAECITCGVIGSSPRREKADEYAKDHAEWHASQGHRARRFRSFREAQRLVSAGA